MGDVSTAPNEQAQSDISNFSVRLDDHEERLAAMERRQDGTDRKLDNISHEVAAVRAEGNARQQATTAGMDRLGAQVTDLNKNISALTGAQTERNRIADDNLRWWKKMVAVVTLICTIGGTICATLLSDQEVASTIWVKWLHWREPWDVPTQTAPQPQTTQFILPPREMEVA